MQMKQVCIAVHTLSEILVRKSACTEKRVLHRAYLRTSFCIAVSSLNRSIGAHAMDPTTLMPLLCSVTYLMRRLRQLTHASSLYCATASRSRRGLRSLWAMRQRCERGVALDSSSICFVAQLQMVLI